MKQQQQPKKQSDEARAVTHRLHQQQAQASLSAHAVAAHSSRRAKDIQKV
jgi:hypothetical protein